MANYLILNQPQVFQGLGTLTYTVPSTGSYAVQVQATEVPPSGLAIVVKDNGSTVYTAPSVTPTQSALQFRKAFQFTSGHSVTVVLSSAEAVDAAYNNVKSIITIQEGQ